MAAPIFYQTFKKEIMAVYRSVNYFTEDKKRNTSKLIIRDECNLDTKWQGHLSEENYRPTLLVNIRCKIPFKKGKYNPEIWKIIIKSHVSADNSRNAKSI